MIRPTILSCAAVLTFTLAASAGTPPPRGGSGFAVVDKDGNLAGGKNATGAIFLSTGTYEVDFASSVNKCAFTATTGLPDSNGSNIAGFVTLAGRGANDKGVYVQTYDAKGVSADRGFHLIVRC